MWRVCEISECDKNAWAKGLCPMHLRRLRVHGSPYTQGKFRDSGTPEERFHAKYIPVTETGCWLWLASTNNHGYGVFFPSHGEAMFAHRYSYEVHFGPVPEGMHVCHKCDTPSCCNPDHLFLGTRFDNMRDASRKGRLNTPRGPRGSAFRLAKLTDDQVRQIRQSNATLADLAGMFGLHVSAVSRVRRRETYRDVD